MPYVFTLRSPHDSTLRLPQNKIVVLLWWGDRRAIIGRARAKRTCEEKIGSTRHPTITSTHLRSPYNRVSLRGEGGGEIESGAYYSFITRPLPSLPSVQVNLKSLPFQKLSKALPKTVSKSQSSSSIQLPFPASMSIPSATSAPSPAATSNESKSTSASQFHQAIVRSVISGDSIVIRPKGVTAANQIQEKTIHIAGVSAPRMGSRDRDDDVSLNFSGRSGRT